jgi:hypothetical protein
MPKKIVYSLMLIILSVFVLANEGKAQNNTAAFAAADTSRFSVNKSDGWQLFNSYITQYHADSARLELIAQHDSNVGWVKEQYIGKIKFATLHPKTEQILLFNLLDNYFQFRIDTSGKCYLKFMYGVPPVSNPMVVPIHVQYKFN